MLEGRARVLGKETGSDFTVNFLRGAREAARLAQVFGVREAWLKSDSPSCGVGRHHSLAGLVEGDGVLAALLRTMGIVLKAEDRDP